MWRAWSRSWPGSLSWSRIQRSWSGIDTKASSLDLALLQLVMNSAQYSTSIIWDTILGSVLDTIRLCVVA
jgi:hypothetical protein